MSADSFLGRVRDAQGANSKVARTLSMDGSGAPPPADTLPPGFAENPDYEIKKELGRGGMGVVYLAHNKLMGRHEVLKVMNKHLMERPGVLERFLREIRAVAKLRHPNIVTAYSATRIGESIVFGMEYVEGLDLSRMVKAKGPLPVGHACNFIYQAALGLQHAHEEGLVHRDIKPHNLMLSRKGDKATVKVLDFGLARVTREEKIDGGLTLEGQALGTPDYIAPEQILDAPSADIRADIYSLGGTLYYLLTGRPPFKANSLYDMYQAHISRDADPLNLVRPEVPAELAALVAKMMSKDPSRRFQTPGEVAEALKPFFKAGNTAFKSRKPELSQTDATPVVKPKHKPTPPRQDSQIPIDLSKNPVSPPASETRWESLIDLRPQDQEEGETPTTDPNRQPPWKSVPVMLAATLFALFALGVFMNMVRDKNGNVISKTEVPEGSKGVVEPRSRKTAETPASDEQQSPTLVKLSSDPTKDAIQEGTHWKGILRHLDGSKLGISFTTVLLITKRSGQELEGVYTVFGTADSFIFKGTFVDGRFAWEMTSPISGTFRREERLTMSGTVRGDRIDMFMDWRRGSEHLTFKGFFLRHGEADDIYADVEAVNIADSAPAGRDGEDLVTEGTVWYGIGTFISGGANRHDFPLIFRIRKRSQGNFEGTYEAGERRDRIWEMQGVVKGNEIEWTTGGVNAWSGSPFKGEVRGDRVDFDLRYQERDGQDGHCKGVFIRDAGNAVASEGVTDTVLLRDRTSVNSSGDLLKDAIREGTQWKGIISAVEAPDPGSFQGSSFAITSKKGSEFEGIYWLIDKRKALNRAHELKGKGSFTDQVISWEMTEPLSGDIRLGDRINLKGTLIDDRIDFLLEWQWQNGDIRMFKGFYLPILSTGDIYYNANLSVKEKVTIPDPSHERDLLPGGTVWCGLGTNQSPPGALRDFPAKIQITKREGNTFLGTFQFDSLRVGPGTQIISIEGTVKGRAIEWTVNEPAEFAGSLYKGVIRGDRIDLDFQYKTKTEENCIGKMVLIRDSRAAASRVAEPGKVVPF